MGVSVPPITTLPRAVHDCIAYAARDWNHPKMSCLETSCKAAPIAAVTVSVVRAATDRNDPLTFENISSIGVMSELHGGSGISSAPAPSTAPTTALTLCGLRLSQ